MIYVLAYDVGTTGVKTCLFGVEDSIRLLESSHEGYGLYMVENGGVEQDADEWWQAMCRTTRRVFERAAVEPEQIAGISFCSQMQGLVLADRQGRPVRRPMSYMDQRAREEMRRGIAYGPRIAGANVWKLLRSLRINGAVASSVKDPVWKYKWVERHEPEAFARVYTWLDVKEYLIARCTGEFVMTEDSAFSTFLYDSRKGKEGWSQSLCRMLGVCPEHLPRLIGASDPAGTLTARAAQELGLKPGILVFGGGGDASLIGVGSGCVRPGKTHIYSGTSGWVSTVVEKQMVDAGSMIAAVVGVQRGRFNYFAEMETAGKCLEWVKDHMALDEIGVYLESRQITCGQEVVYTSLYDYLTETVKRVEPGAGGVLFTPWLHGNRCPFEDPNAAGMFFNISLDTGKTEMIRAVLEGICYHLRWMLECQDRKVKTSETIRFSGGGALADVTSQMLADITGRRIEVVDSPQNVGAVGAAATAAVGLKVIDRLENIEDFIPACKAFEPDRERKKIYDHYFEVFKQLYRSNRKNFAALNHTGGSPE